MVGLFALLAAVGYGEMLTATWQARYLHKLGQELSFQTAPGRSDSVRFPTHGPFDLRMGYAQLPRYSEHLSQQGFEITRQARMSPKMLELIEHGLFPTYREKTHAGLRLFDRGGSTLYEVRYPERGYVNFDAVPRLIVESLLFIENRELLDPDHSKKNPAVEWDRLAKAVLDQMRHVIDPEQETPGGSTLATQIEKYRHSPDGRTGNVREKFRQMASAALRAYQSSEDTLPVRQKLVVDYLNTVPLAAKPGMGEVNGVGDGMWAWYGRDFAEVNRILHERTGGGASLAEQALAYKQVLSLMVSQRAPSYYFLAGRRDELDALTNSLLRLLTQAGVITTALRDAALGIKLAFAPQAAKPAPQSFVTRKAVTAVRSELAGMLDIERLYDLDRLDLSVNSTLDAQLQAAVTDVLRGLRDTTKAREVGLLQPRILDKGDPAKVIYSFTLFEATRGANLLRAQADNFDQPFDINEGAKLDLGSTAKLRTLITYLDVVATLHETYVGKPQAELVAIKVDDRDRLTRWAIDYLAKIPGASLEAMLEAAMDRYYSASPAESFFTGGGLHQFSNFNPADDHRVMTVHEAMRNSVNLVFVRLMRDVVRYSMFNTRGSSATVLSDPADPRRTEYLQRFADREGRIYMSRFYPKYRGKTVEQAEQLLLQSVRPTRDKLSAVFRTIAPDADESAFAAHLGRYLRDDQPDAEEVSALYQRFAPAEMSLADRGYVAGVHPLELWLVGYLRGHPDATLQQALEASSAERQAVYAWLFKTRHKNAQDRRILSLLELEGFLEIHRQWKRLGYPFDTLVPSYGTALGSSADRPAALAELMGIIVNDGRRLPAARVDKLHFAVATPYETVLERQPATGEQVLAAPIARVVRRALTDVVNNGTARTLRGVFVGSGGAPIEVGGKTGTGDNRFHTYDRHGRLIHSRVVSRSATFMFFLGDKYFGTLTAYVAGDDAAKFQFTSALAVQILKHLAPTLNPLLAE